MKNCSNEITCFNETRRKEGCTSKVCFKCSREVCCESFTSSRIARFNKFPICETCSTEEALSDYLRSINTDRIRNL